MAGFKRLRFGLLFGVFAGIALVLAGSAGAGAQNSNATVRVEVRYPNGSLTTNTQICSYVQSTSLGSPSGGKQYTNAVFTSVTNQVIQESGPISNIAVPPGQYVAYAYDCTSLNSKFMTAYNFGPAGPWEVGGHHLAIHSFSVSAGETTVVPLTVGRGIITGRYDGANSCGVSAFGVPDFGNQVERQFGRSGASSPTSTTYSIAVPPGLYRIEAVCAGVPMHHPAGSTIDTARYVRVGHGQTVAGINFGSPTGGSAGYRSFPIAKSAELLSFCVESTAPDGTLFHRQYISESFDRDRPAPIAFALLPDGDYRLRFVDCMGLGFDSFWYPSAETMADSELLREFEPISTPVDLLASGKALCNGEVATILGNGAPNILRGTAAADVIIAGGGNDIVTGLAGNDTICSGDGDDRVFGNAGADWIDAGAGNDWVGAGWGEDIVYGGAGNDFICGFKHNDTVYGGTGNDRITGGWGNDVLRGGPGNDTLRAYFGADKLFGDAGDDALLGGNGPDSLVGGPGASDRLFGDQGRDTCNDVGASSQFTECEFINE